MGRQRSQDTTGAGPRRPRQRDHALAWSDVIARSPLALAILDPETFSIRYMSAAFHEVTGVPWEELLNRPLPDLLPAPGAEKLLSVLSATREAGAARRATDVPYLHPEHGLVSWDCAVWPFSDGEAGYEGLSVHVSVVTDAAAEHDRLSQVAEQIRSANEHLLIAGVRQLELAEQASHHARLLDDLLASQAGGVLVVDGSGNVVMLNSPARQMLGLPDAADPTIAARLRELDLQRADGCPLPADERPIERLLRGEPFSDLELSLLRPDGETKRIAFNGSAIADPDSSAPSLAILVFYEVTAKRRLDDLRSDYIALISHDLRAPLSTIFGYAELIRLMVAGDVTGRASEWMARIEQAARQMATMIDDLVESTRLESGTLQLSREPAELQAIVQGVVQELPSPVDRDRIVVEALAEALNVSADKARFARVVVNLLSNALKYSPPVSPVTIRLRQDAGEGILSVTDRGRGLPPESISRLFQRFYRVDPDSRVEGMGLGLYIARLIVEAHGGRIWVESEPGQGSTFSVSLPLA
jgi:signal transduction histidine kinase